MKDTLSSFDICALVCEFQQLIDGRIEQLYQPEKDKFFLKLKLPSKNKIGLLIKNGKWLNLTQKEQTMPKTPTSFIMAMRKLLANGKIKSVSQHNLERIIIFEIEKAGFLHKLIIELFSKGNIILVDSQGVILLSFVSHSWKTRIIKKGEEYSSPPSRFNFLDTNLDLFKTMLKNSNKDLVRTLATTFNLGGLWSEEICLRARIAKNRSVEDLGEDEIERVYEVIAELIDQFKQRKFQPSLVYKIKNGEKELVDMTPIKFLMYESEGYSIKEMESFSQAADFYWKEEVKKDERQIKFESELAKLERILAIQKETRHRLEKEANELKRKGDLLYINYKKCEELLGGERDKEEKIIELFDPERGTTRLSIDPSKNVAQNAEVYYLKAKQISKKLEGVKRAMQDFQIRIKKTAKEGIRIKASVLAKKPRHRYWFEKYRWFISSNENLILAGKDASSNDQLVKRHMKQNDKYVHADIWGASSCVVKASDFRDKPLEINDVALKEACQFASVYSKGWGRYSSIQAYWVEPEQVSKSADSGEWVPRGAWIIRGKRNYKKCDLEIAVGEIRLDDEERVMGGPPSVFINRSKRCVVLEPGSKDKNLVAKQIAKAMNLPFEEVQRQMPPGNVSVKAIYGIKDENISTE